MKVLIIEDEAAAARRLQKILGAIDPALEVIDILDSIESTLIWWSQHPAPELIFLDIHLADGSCFELFNHLTIETPIVFVTAYDQYALQAFKVNAIDYLLKPVKEKELEQALQKFRKRQQTAPLNYQKLAGLLGADASPKRFLIRTGPNIRVVEMKDAAYFYTENKITFLVARTGKRFAIDHSLEKLEEMLDPQQFFRINRQFIIGVDAIDHMVAYSKSRVKIELNPPCDLETVVSTERSPHFKKWLSGED